MTNKRKQSLYFPDEMLAELEAESKRLDRSMSWVVQQAWELSKARIKNIPTQKTPEE